MKVYRLQGSAYRRWITLVLIFVAAPVRSDWTLIEPAPVEIGRLVTHVTSTDPLAAVMIAASRSADDPTRWRFTLFRAVDDTVVQREITGLDPEIFNHAFLSVLIDVHDQLVLVLSKRSRLQVWAIDPEVANAEPLLDFEAEDEGFIAAYGIENSVFVSSHQALRVSRLDDPTVWQTHEFGDLQLIDAGVGDGDCAIDAVMRGSNGIGVYCMNADGVDPKPQFSLNEYGLDARHPVVLIGGTAQHVALLGFSNQAQVALVCMRASGFCQASTLSGMAFPGLRPIWRTMALIPGTTTAISVRTSSKAGGSEIFAHDLLSGLTAPLRSIESPKPDVEGQAWRGFLSATVEAAGDSVGVMLDTRSGAVVNGDSGSTFNHGMSVLPLSFSATDVELALQPD